MHKQKRRHFHAKMTSVKLYIYIGVGEGTCSLTKHTRRWAYSQYLFPACCLLRFAAFFGSVWPCLTPFGPIWSHSAPHGTVWSCLYPISPGFGSFRPIWSHLVLFSSVSPYLTQFYPIWLHLALIPLLVPFWLVVSRFAPFGPV